MIVAVMQPYFFPYIGYWKLMEACDYFVVFDDVHYINKGFIDRNTIIENGQRRYIKLKVANRSQNSLICDLKVHEKPLDVAKTTYHAYKKAPFFKDCFPVVEEICDSDEISLSQFLMFAIQRLAAFLSIDCKLILSSSIKSHHSGKDKIIPMVKHLGGTSYVNMEGGASLYDQRLFDRAGLELDFISADDPSALSARVEAYGNLSIIDSLMHFGPGGVREAIL